jgi:hypothetical protein
MAKLETTTLFQTLDCEQVEETMNGGYQSCQWTYVPTPVYDFARRRFVYKLVLKRQCYWV